MHGTVLVEPKYEIANGDSLLYPARSIAYIDNNTIPIKILNVNNFPVRIFADRCVARAETVEETQIGSESKDKDKGESELNHISSDSWINDVDLSNYIHSANERQRLLHLLIDYQNVFVKSRNKFGQAHRFAHSIGVLTISLIYPYYDGDLLRG